MFEVERFAFKMEGDPAHYLFWLGLALCLWQATALMRSWFSWSTSQKLELAFASSVAFGFALHSGFSSFVFLFGLLLSVFAALKSASEAVGFTLILYVCRPWEVFPTNDWWSQVPRQCIGIWLLSWFRELTANPHLLSGSFRFSRGVGLSLIFGVWCLLTTFVSKDVPGSQDYFLSTLFRAITLVLILHLTIRSVADAVRLQMAFVIGVSTLALFSLWRFHGLDQHALVELLQRGGVDQTRRLEAIGSLGNSNDVAAVLLIPLGFIWPQLLSLGGLLGSRILLMVPCCFLMLALFASQSRGALLAVVAQIGMFFVQKSHRPKMLLVVLGLAVGFVSMFASQLMGRHADDLEASTESRMNYYVTGVYMLLNSPVWGQGFGRYPYEFERFSPIILHEWGLRTAHSSWVLVFAETGLVGLLLFCWINYTIGADCWQLRKSSPGPLLAFTGYSLTIVFLSHSWLMFPWILFSLIDLHCKYSRREIEPNA